LAHKNSKWNCISFNLSGTLIATGGDDKTVSLWNTNKGFVMSKFEHLSAAVSVLKYSLDLIGVGTVDGKIKILSTEPGL
jgi:WD40 repeat protein